MSLINGPLFPTSSIHKPRIIELKADMNFNGIIPGKTRFRYNRADNEYVSLDPSILQRFEGEIMDYPEKAIFFKIISA